MGAFYIQLKNSIIEGPITHDYTDPSVVRWDLCTEYLTSKFPSTTHANLFGTRKISTVDLHGFRFPVRFHVINQKPVTGVSRHQETDESTGP